MTSPTTTTEQDNNNQSSSSIFNSLFNTVYSAYKFIEDAIYSDPFEIPQLSAETLAVVVDKIQPLPEDMLKLKKILDTFLSHTQSKYVHSIDRIVSVGGFNRITNIRRENTFHLVIFVNNGKCDSRITHMTWSNCDTCFLKDPASILSTWSNDFCSSVLDKIKSAEDRIEIGTDNLMTNQIKYYSKINDVTYYISFAPSGQTFTNPMTIGALSLDNQKLLYPALAESRSAYLEKYTQGFHVKLLIRLMKQWMKECSWANTNATPSEYFLELLVIEVLSKNVDTTTTVIDIPQLFTKVLLELLQMATDSSQNSIDPVLMDPVQSINLASDIRIWPEIRANCRRTLEKFGFKFINTHTNSESDQDKVLEALAEYQDEKEKQLCQDVSLSDDDDDDDDEI
jgi:hypothetical protein